jgi:hypothetical protein
LGGPLPVCGNAAKHLGTGLREKNKKVSNMFFVQH